MSTSNILVDASVVAKWFLADEDDASFALKIKQDFLLRKVSISVPLFIFYEISNLLKSASKSIRITEKEAQDAFEGFLDLNFIIYSTKELLKKTLEKAILYDISSYDASYIALAEYLKVSFFTADYKLLTKVKNKLVKNLNEYQFR